MSKGTKRKCHPTQPKKTRPITMQNQGPKDEENKPITEANHLNLTQNHHGPSHNAHKR